MACLLPHTDFEIEALVQRLINEDKGRQDVLLNLAFQFEDSCTVTDNLRKTYEKCCSSSQTDFPLAEKELHQLRMDEEVLKEMLEEEAMNKKAQEEKIRQEQAENDAFFLEFRVVSVPQEEDHQYLVVILGLIVPLIIVAIGVEASGRSSFLPVG
ncbi:hypothetical protein Tco_0434710 [Tanacetum coccineum]